MDPAVVVNPWIYEAVRIQPHDDSLVGPLGSRTLTLDGGYSQTV